MLQNRKILWAAILFEIFQNIYFDVTIQLVFTARSLLITLDNMQYGRKIQKLNILKIKWAFEMK